MALTRTASACRIHRPGQPITSQAALGATLPGKATMPLKVREMISKIESDGWTLVRTRGSHRHYVHPVKPGVVTIAGRLGADLPVGTERSILKQAGL